MLKAVVMGKKGLSGRIGTFSGPILEQIGTFSRYFHKNAKKLKNCVIDKKIFYNNSRTVSFFQIYRHGTLLRYLH